MRIDRILFTAPASGCGKTTVTCAVLGALKKLGRRPVSFKTGPDYIDPMFHRQVLGIPSANLDLFLTPAGTAQWLFCRHAARGDIAVVEGAMGYYDGIAAGEDASAYQVARLTGTPAVLVADAAGMSLSAAALLEGFARFRQDSGIAGVIFNRMSPALYSRMAELVRRETSLIPLGYLPRMEEAAFESRHLGLVTAGEIEGVRRKLELLARQALRTIDLQGLLRLAAGAGELEAREPFSVPRLRPVRLAVARDRAFCFYYEDSLELLRQMGAQLIPFSPLEDAALPGEADGLYLGGGYPELSAEQLSRNLPMRKSVAAAVQNGMPALAECGGFLYLHGQLSDPQGRAWPMAGVIPARAENGGRLRQFGYASLTACGDGLLAREGEALPAHEFHYWQSSAPGEGFAAQKPQSSRGWRCGYHTPRLYAGFPHFHFWGMPRAAERFLRAMAAYQEERAV